MINHDLAPYFDEEILKTVESKFVICFDEAFNEVSFFLKKEKGQINLVIRDFSNVFHQVSSHYLSSSFIDHSTAEATGKISWKFQAK